jgi:hypothetical protein
MNPAWTERRSLLFPCAHHNIQAVKALTITVFTYRAELSCGCIWAQTDEHEWKQIKHRQQRTFGKPMIVPNQPDPFKCSNIQLMDLDKIILSIFPEAYLSEGLKYARWADMPTCVTDEQLGQLALADAYPDFIFDGYVFGRKKLILMWLPFFD